MPQTSPRPIAHPDGRMPTTTTQTTPSDSLANRSNLPAKIAAGDRDGAIDPEPVRNTLRFIILGLLGAHPMSGYDIKRAFDRSIATYWNAGHSQIYTTLKALDQRGLVTSELIYQESRPNRRVYQLTPGGRDALDAWLAEPIPPRFTKDEFLTKLFFCGQTSDQAALQHLETHLSALEAQLGDMELALREYGNRPTRHPRLLEYQMLVRDYKQAILQADLEMTMRAIARIRSHQVPNPD